ncbi:HAD family phosphatase [Collinsella sp. AF14-35]|nr:HAD family phosphatase [Collinsella sp. AF14-35]
MTFYPLQTEPPWVFCMMAQTRLFNDREAYMAIKAIAMDIDGTLTNDQKVISPRTCEKLLAAQESGIKLILASGRPAWGLHALAQELDLQNHDGLLVAFNGAHVVDAQTDEVLFDQAMPADELHRLIDHLRNFDVIPMISLGRDLHVEDSYHCMITLPDGLRKNIVKYERDACDLKIREVESLHEVVDTYPVDKLLTAGDPTYLQAHYEEMYAPFTQTLSGMFTADWYFEYTAPGIDKARALEGALPKLGIDASEVVSFGDGQNDKSMIEWAGTGVAMGNAVDEVKAVAQMVTADNNEDGIAVALDKLLG